MPARTGSSSMRERLERAARRRRFASLFGVPFHVRAKAWLFGFLGIGSGKYD